MNISISKKLREISALIRVFFYPETKHYSGISVVGSKEFRNSVFDALEILEAKAKDFYDFVKVHIGYIMESSRSATSPYTNPPACRISRNDIKRGSVELVIGSLLCGAYRSKLYSDYQKKTGLKKVPRSVWASDDASEVCLNFAYEVLKNMGVSREILDSL
jgi:hypothetical protein